MSKHTPGPWKFGGLSNTILHGSYTVATMPNEYEDNAVDQWGSPEKALAGVSADARLIAALPDLLAALQAACDIIDLEAAIYSARAKVEHETANTRSAGNLKAKVNFFRATIAKATGGDL